MWRCERGGVVVAHEGEGGTRSASVVSAARRVKRRSSGDEGTRPEEKGQHRCVRDLIIGGSSTSRVHRGETPRPGALRPGDRTRGKERTGGFSLRPRGFLAWSAMRSTYFAFSPAASQTPFVQRTTPGSSRRTWSRDGGDRVGCARRNAVRPPARRHHTRRPCVRG